MEGLIPYVLHAIKNKNVTKYRRLSDDSNRSHWPLMEAAAVEGSSHGRTRPSSEMVGSSMAPYIGGSPFSDATKRNQPRKSPYIRHGAREKLMKKIKDSP